MGTDVARLFKDLWAKVQPCFPPTLWRSGSCCLSHSGLHVLLREAELPFAVPSATWTKQRERTYSTVGVCWSQISQDAPLDGATKQCVGHSMAALTELNQTKQYKTDNSNIMSCPAFFSCLVPRPFQCWLTRTGSMMWRHSAFGQSLTLILSGFYLFGVATVWIFVGFVGFAGPFF